MEHGYFGEEGMRHADLLWGLAWGDETLGKSGETKEEWIQANVEETIFELLKY